MKLPESVDESVFGDFDRLSRDHPVRSKVFARTGFRFRRLVGIRSGDEKVVEPFSAGPLTELLKATITFSVHRKHFK